MKILSIDYFRLFNGVLHLFEYLWTVIIFFPWTVAQFFLKIAFLGNYIKSWSCVGIKIFICQGSNNITPHVRKPNVKVIRLFNVKVSTRKPTDIYNHDVPGKAINPLRLRGLHVVKVKGDFSQEKWQYRNRVQEKYLNVINQGAMKSVGISKRGNCEKTIC